MNLFELFVKIGVEDTASGKLKVIGQSLGNGLKNAAKIGIAAIGAASAAVVAFGASAVKTGAEFDTAMSQVAATMGKTVDEVQELRDFAQQMGSTTVFSATQSAEALNYMALAGYDAKQAMSALPTVLNLAAAGSIDLAYASDMVTDAQSALGLSMEESSIMVDQMAKTASKSNTSVSQLGEAILTVGGTASYMAGGTEQINKVLGVLADNGIKGAEAGTHLRNMLLSLSAPTDNAQAIIDKFGLQIFDADGKMRDFAEIFPELNAAMDGLTDQEKLDAFSQLFNTRDIASATALLNTSVDRWEELGDAIVDSKGAAEAMAETQLDNLNGDITLFKSALEGARITISDQLTPTLREFVQFGSKGLSELTDGFKGGGLSGAMDAFGSLLSEGLAKIAGSLPSVVNAGVSLLQAFIAGISQNSDLLVEAFFGVFETIVSEFPALIESFTELIPELLDSILEQLPGAIETIVTALTDGGVIESLTQAVVGIVQAIANNLPNIIQAIVDAIPRITESVNSAILGNFPQILDAIIQIVLSIIDNLPTVIEMLVEQIGPIVSTIVQVIVENLPAFIEGIIQIVIGIVKALPSIMASVGESVMQIFKGIGTGLANAWPKFKEGISQIWDKVTAWFAGLWSKTREIGQNIIDGIRAGISNAWASLKSWFEGLFGDLIGVAKRILGIASPSKVFKKIGLQTAEGYGVGFEDEFAKVKDDMEDAMSFDDVSVGINSSIRKVGAGSAGMPYGGTSIGNITINIDGARYEDEQSLAAAISEAIQNMTDRRAAVYA